MLPHSGIVLFLGGISIIFWYWIFIVLKVLPSFTVISCKQFLFSKIFHLVVYHVIILGHMAQLILKITQITVSSKIPCFFYHWGLLLETLAAMS